MADHTLQAYREAVHLALVDQPHLARALVEAHDHRIPPGAYPFRVEDESWLAGRAASGDPDVLVVVFALASRIPLPEVRLTVRDRLADVVGGQGDAARLIGHLRQWWDAGALDAAGLTLALLAFLRVSSLDKAAPQWREFFDDLPESLLPDLFEVHYLLGRGADVVRLAESRSAQRRALLCCLGSPRLGDLQAGIEMARRVEPAQVAILQERRGALLAADARWAAAAEAYAEAGRLDLVSDCQERLGLLEEALNSCPADQPDRMARLTEASQFKVDALVERRDLVGAIRLTREMIRHIGRATGESEALSHRLEELRDLRLAILATGRQHYRERAERATRAACGQGDGGPGEERRIREAYQEWSQFEEEAGEAGEAAVRAEQAGDGYRAHRFYRQAERFGDAARVVSDDASAEGLAARATALHEGGDLLGAARLYQDSGEADRAANLFAEAGDLASAASCLIACRGELALADPRLREWLRRSGEVDEYARLCLLAAAGTGTWSEYAADELRQLNREVSGGHLTLSSAVASEIAGRVEALDGHCRRVFEERAQGWVAQARNEIDGRFAGIWALDLGTTTCAAAIYDADVGKAVLCPWKGRPQYASTLSLDRDGNELVGLTGDEVFGGWLLGHANGAKRKMGTRETYQIHDRDYRPEEVAARLIQHGRQLVEGFLAEQVRQRVAELATAELGTVQDGWLTWAERHHNLRLERRRVLVTIPAYFLNNQKHATRDACRIAGVELVRLIHEPTAACITAARERRLSGNIVVVDLGAGTLDVSLLEVDDGVYEVHQVLGDNQYGGSDFDTIVEARLRERLAASGVDVPEIGVAGDRLRVAAEYLKVSLSSGRTAEYQLLDLVDGKDVRLELTRRELGEILEKRLGVLREMCATFRESLRDQPEYLVLVGGPMLSPLVRRVVEEVFELAHTPLPDSRTAVAMGAALQAAVLDGKLSDLLLLDVTPLALGIRTMNSDNEQELSVLIPSNTRIPTQQCKTYTTVTDDQTSVKIEVFNGSLAPSAQIGQFRLGDIAASTAGLPKIEVTFSIDVNCVLEVSAQDLATGSARSIRVADTTLLSPTEVDEMARRQRRQADLRELRQELANLIRQPLAEDAEILWCEFRGRLSAYRPPRVPHDAVTQRGLATMFDESNEVEVHLRTATALFRDLIGTVRDYLERNVADDAQRALAEGGHLIRELRERRQKLEVLVSRLSRWNAILVKVALSEPDPLSQFRQRHDTGAYASALAALRNADVQPDQPQDVRRYLRCLAMIGEAEEYRTTLITQASRLGIGLADPEDPDTLVRQLGRCLVWATARGPEGRPIRRRGFLVAPDIVATNRHWLGRQSRAGDDSVIEGVFVEGRRVDAIGTPDSAAVDVALLHLSHPVETPDSRPVPLGHAAMVRVGDTVWTSPRGDDLSSGLASGLIDGFESFPEQDLRLFRLGIGLEPQASGCPILNDLGEAVGLLVIGDQQTKSSFAIAIDTLTEILGRVPWPDTAVWSDRSPANREGGAGTGDS